MGTPKVMNGGLIGGDLTDPENDMEYPSRLVNDTGPVAPLRSCHRAAASA